MAWAAPSKVIWGSIAFVVWWMLSVFPALPLLPIGRTAGSVLGGTLMVVFQVLSPNQAFDAVDLSILGLLFGTMVVSVMLQQAGLFSYLGYVLSWRTRGGMDLLCRVSLLAALSSALFTNDTTCVFFTGFVLKLCRDKNLDPKPFLLALACSANIGSAATPIGNPQNLVIAVNSGISFGRFLAGVLPAMALGLGVNTLMLVVVYGRHLSLGSSLSQDASLSMGVEITGNRQDGGEGVHGIAPNRTDHREARLATFSHQTSLAGLSGPRESISESWRNVQIGEGNGEIFDEKLECAEQGRSDREGGVRRIVPGHDDDHHETVEPDSPPRRSFRVASDHVSGVVTLQNAFKYIGAFICGRISISTLKLSVRESWRQRKEKIWKASVYLVTLGMLAALLAGLSLPWTALTAAVAMLVLNFSDAGPSLDKVSYNLLVFFSGMFIATSGFNATGAPQEFWSAVEPHSRIDTASGVSVLSLVVTVLSNVVSNVPTVILLGGKVAASAVTSGASSDKAWLILAWVSTVAGNLTLVGSAANIIVCEEARETQAEKDQSNNLAGDSLGPARATYDLTFWNHLKFGFPSTLIVIAVGLIPIALRKF